MCIRVEQVLMLLEQASVDVYVFHVRKILQNLNINDLITGRLALQGNISVIPHYRGIEIDIPIACEDSSLSKEIEQVGLTVVDQINNKLKYFSRRRLVVSKFEHQFSVTRRDDRKDYIDRLTVFVEVK